MYSAPLAIPSDQLPAVTRCCVICKAIIAPERGMFCTFCYQVPLMKDQDEGEEMLSQNFDVYRTRPRPTSAASAEQTDWMAGFVSSSKGETHPIDDPINNNTTPLEIPAKNAGSSTHIKSAAVESEKTKRRSCMWPGFKRDFKEKKPMLKHLMNHKEGQRLRVVNDKPFSGTICDTTFTTNSNKLAHDGNAHRDTFTAEPEKGPFRCCVCGLSYKTKQNKERHEQTVHSGNLNMGVQGEFTCKICGHLFATKYTWYMHEKAHSDNGKIKVPFSCSICGALFTTNQAKRGMRKMCIESKSPPSLRSALGLRTKLAARGRAEGS